MNVLHLKYAVEVAKNGSINKAAEALYMNQPNLSRAIKDLEASLGITIFGRSSKGMYVTPEGEEFLAHAQKILAQIDEVEALYQQGRQPQQRFSISVPRASYISQAFAHFSRQLSPGKAELLYEETNATRVIQNVLGADYNLGILRYASAFDKYFKNLLDDKGLTGELIAEFHYMLLLSRKHPLAEKEDVSLEDLRPFIQIAHADPSVPSLPLNVVKKEELAEEHNRRIYVFDRASQFELLSENPETFMWVSPVPGQLLQRYGLVQKNCSCNQKQYKDTLIYKKGYRLSALDNAFITELCNAKRHYIRQSPSSP